MPTVFLWSTDHSLSRDNVNELAQFLSADELTRAKAFKFTVDRERFVAGRAFLRRILALHLNCSATDIEFKTTELGKPFLSDPDNSQLQFSFSRSGSYSVCVIMNGLPIGIDIECARELNDMRLSAETMFSGPEFDRWQDMPDFRRVDCFYRVWTRKEAVGKALGTGISIGPENIRVPLDENEQGASSIVDSQNHTLVLADWTPFPETSSSVAFVNDLHQTLEFGDSFHKPGKRVILDGRVVTIPSTFGLTIRRYRPRPTRQSG